MVKIVKCNFRKIFEVDPITKLILAKIDFLKLSQLHIKYQKKFLEDLGEPKLLKLETKLK